MLSSRPDVFCKKGVLRNFTKFRGLRPATLLKKRLCHRCFTVNFEKFLRTPFFFEHLRWLLLGIAKLTFTCSKSPTEPLEKGVKYVHGAFIVSFKHFPHLFLEFLLVTWSK